jgi:hypothetical protein
MVSAWLIVDMALCGSIFLGLVLGIFAEIITIIVMHLKYVRKVQAFLTWIIRKAMAQEIQQMSYALKGIVLRPPTLIELSKKQFGNGPGQVSTFDHCLVTCTDYAHTK